MAEAVQPDRMPGGDDLGQQGRPALHLLTDHEEGRRRRGPGQHLEHRGSALRMRPVVEGQGDARGRREAPGQAERIGGAEVDRGEQMGEHVMDDR